MRKFKPLFASVLLLSLSITVIAKATANTEMWHLDAFNNNTPCFQMNWYRSDSIHFNIELLNTHGAVIENGTGMMSKESDKFAGFATISTNHCQFSGAINNKIIGGTLICEQPAGQLFRFTGYISDTHLPLANSPSSDLLRHNTYSSIRR